MFSLKQGLIIKNMFLNISFKSNFRSFKHELYFSSTKKIISQSKNQINWNFSYFDSGKTYIDCVMVQNNSQINIKWLKKSIQQTQAILLADGGANIFFQAKLQEHQPKIKGIIGDLDSIQQSTHRYYKHKNIPIIKIQDQNKNDYQKTMDFAIDKNYKNIFVFGALGGRFDHTLSTMSNSQKFMKANPQTNIVLIGKQTVMCLFRTGYRHQINLSDDICRKGCGLVTFSKVTGIQTNGLKWNIGKNHQFDQLQWGSFISSSNQIIGEQIIVQSPKQNAIISFVANLKN